MPRPRLRKSSQIFELDNLAIKGIQAKGNRVSSKSVQSLKLATERIEVQERLPLPEISEL